MTIRYCDFCEDTELHPHQIEFAAGHRLDICAKCWQRLQKIVSGKEWKGPEPKAYPWVKKND